MKDNLVTIYIEGGVCIDVRQDGKSIPYNLVDYDNGPRLGCTCRTGMDMCQECYAEAVGSQMG